MEKRGVRERKEGDEGKGEVEREREGRAGE